jgi:hypothetical protein
MVVLNLDDQGRTDDEVPREGDDQLWGIHIGGYGSFPFRGNEDDCEVLRSGKAEWEGSGGTKWRIDDLVTRIDGRLTQGLLNDLKRTFRAFPNVRPTDPVWAALSRAHPGNGVSEPKWPKVHRSAVKNALESHIADAMESKQTSDWTNYGRA